MQQVVKYYVFSSETLRSVIWSRECACGDKCCGMILCSMLLLFHFPVNNSGFTILWNTGSSCCGVFTLCYLETPTGDRHTFPVSAESALVRTDDGGGCKREKEYEGCGTWGVSTLAERYTVDTSRVSPLLPSYCFTSFSTVQARRHAPSPNTFPSTPVHFDESAICLFDLQISFLGLCFYPKQCCKHLLRIFACCDIKFPYL